MPHKNKPKIAKLSRIPIAEVGEWDCLTGKTEFTVEMMESAVRASSDPGIGLPKLKRGHIDPRFDGEPLIGLATNLTFDDNGLVVADLDGLDTDEFGENGEVLPFRYPDRSIEGRRNVTSPVTGETYPFVISALALLPHDGAVDTLPDLPLPEHLEAGELVAASKHFSADVLASWSPDTVRSEYENSHRPADPDKGPWPYVMRVEVDPNSVIVVEGADYFRVPFTIDDSGEVAFDDASRVEVEQSFIPKSSSPEGSVAASAAPRVVGRYEPGRSTGQNTNNNKEESMDYAKLKTLFGLGDDATDEQVRAAAKENGLTIADNDGGDPPADDKDKGGDPAPNLVEQAKAQGLALVDEGTLNTLKEGVEVAASMKREKDETERDAFLNEAVMAGKFAPARVDHFKTSWAADPEGTKALIDGMAAGLVPVTAEAGIMAGKSATGHEAQVDDLAAMFGVQNVTGKGASA